MLSNNTQTTTSAFVSEISIPQILQTGAEPGHMENKPDVLGNENTEEFPRFMLNFPPAFS